MKTIEVTANRCLVPIEDFQAGRGWNNSNESQTQARWCCEQLEEGRILFFGGAPFDFPEADRQFLLSQRLGDSRLHKNISYRPKQDLVRGFASVVPGAQERMRQVMRRYSQLTMKFLAELLAPYEPAWSMDYASFRPEAEQSRKLPLRKRNDLLHVDAFPSRPSRGGRILRCFSNINPVEPRIWQTTSPFADLARDYALEAGLGEIAARGTTRLEVVTRAIKKAVGLRGEAPSPYDKFMVRFHDYLKENAGFQQQCRKIRLEFPPGSTWICFTDAVPHAVLSGQFAVEQTLFVPIFAMLSPQKSPLRVLEALAGRSLA